MNVSQGSEGARPPKPAPDVPVAATPLLRAASLVLAGLLACLVGALLLFGVEAGLRFDTSSLLLQLQAAARSALAGEAVLVLTPLVGVLIAIAIFAAQDSDEDRAPSASALELVSIGVGGIAFLEGVLASVGAAVDAEHRGSLLHVLALATVTFLGAVLTSYWSSWRPTVRVRVARQIASRAGKVLRRLGKPEIRSDVWAVRNVLAVRALAVAGVDTILTSVIARLDLSTAVVATCLIVVQTLIAFACFTGLLTFWFGAPSKRFALLETIPMSVMTTVLIATEVGALWASPPLLWQVSIVWTAAAALTFLPLGPRRTRLPSAVRRIAQNQAERDTGWTTRVIDALG